MDRELTKVIEGFDRVRNFEALRLTNEMKPVSSHFSICRWLILSGFGVERAEQERVE